MGESEKIKCIGAAALFPGVFPFKSTETYVPTFCRVDFQTVFVKSVLKATLYSLCVVGIANYTDKVVSISDDFTKPCHMAFDCLFKPGVQYIVQEDICQYRT